MKDKYIDSMSKLSVSASKTGEAFKIITETLKDIKNRNVKYDNNSMYHK